MADKNTAAAAALSATAPAKRVRGKKEPSLARKTAMAAVENAQAEYDKAKSPQEKAIAESRLKNVRDALKLLKFTEIGAPRIRRAINVMRQLENVANRSQYKWTDEQALKATKALTEALRKFTDKLAGNKDGKADEFTF